LVSIGSVGSVGFVWAALVSDGSLSIGSVSTSLVSNG
jgi:hypothetical protein